MTRYHGAEGFSLSATSSSTRLLLALFLVFVLGGLVVALLEYFDRAGLGYRAAVEWVHGNEEDLQALEIKAPKSYRELLSITHEHAFSLALLLFVLLHLVALTSLGDGWKKTFYLAAFSSLGGSLAGPWLVAYLGEGWTWVLLAAGCGLVLSIAASSMVCLFELAVRRGASPKRNRTGGKGFP